MRAMIASACPNGSSLEIRRHYLFRMGVILWKMAASGVKAG
jgi:hypothetical protein